MTWRAYSVPGRVVWVEELADVVAVRQPDSTDVTGGVTFEPLPPDPGLLWQSDGPVDSIPRETRLAFRQAGWAFVPAAASWSDEERTRWEHALVFRAEDGATLLSRGLLAVKFVPHLSDAEVAAMIDAHGATVVRPLLFAPRLFELHVGEGKVIEVANALAADPRVVYAEPEMERIIASRGAEDGPLSASGPEYQWHIRNDGRSGGRVGADLDVETAWTTARGRGVRVAVLDSGCHVAHPDLRDGIDGAAAARFRSAGHGVELVRGLADFPPQGHGTMCLGMVGARRANGIGCVGVAPEAGLIPIACVARGAATQVTVARAIAYAVCPQCEGAPPSVAGADVIVCSLAVNQLGPVLADALAFAEQRGRHGRGVPLFWAVSNSRDPVAWDKVCSHPFTIAVGLSDRKDGRGICAYGEALDFLAPGEDVRSTTRRKGYATDSGTSYAAPCAAGVAALVLEANPSLSWGQVRGILRESCDKPGSPSSYVGGRNDCFGFGRLNAARAVALAVAARRHCCADPVDAALAWTDRRRAEPEDAEVWERGVGHAL